MKTTSCDINKSMAAPARISMNSNTIPQYQNRQAILNTLSRLMADTISLRGDDRPIHENATQTTDSEVPPPTYAMAVGFPPTPAPSRRGSDNDCNSTDANKDQRQRASIPVPTRNMHVEEESDGDDAGEERPTAGATLSDSVNRQLLSRNKASKPESTHHIIEIDASTLVQGCNNVVHAQTLEQNSLLAARIATALAVVLHGDTARLTPEQAGRVPGLGGFSRSILASLRAANCAVINGDKPIHVKLQCGLKIEGERNVVGVSSSRQAPLQNASPGVSSVPTSPYSEPPSVATGFASGTRSQKRKTTSSPCNAEGTAAASVGEGEDEARRRRRRRVTRPRK